MRRVRAAGTRPSPPLPGRAGAHRRRADPPRRARARRPRNERTAVATVRLLPGLSTRALRPTANERAGLLPIPCADQSVWEERRHLWLRLPDDIEHVS